MDVAKSLQQVLGSDSYLKNFDLSVNYSGGCVKVEGKVNLYHHKQIVNHVIFNFIQKNNLTLTLENNVRVSN